ncbi:hypothetical protein ONS95_007563 [Cadophora gregata]|uniref:uncharacterized protein n=1 Tax=Cadophora gregata TaxID=51156 RepID=UPI0026DC5AE8|nr:uncharacterized protein ONS95_007563 [Cadophora gregata]KAK0125939.1 hypothetical protein ONS95_007563 [Cadophora gregata]
MIFANLKTGNYMQALSYLPCGALIKKHLSGLFIPRKLLQEKKAHHALTVSKVMNRLVVTDPEKQNDLLGCILRKTGSVSGPGSGPGHENDILRTGMNTQELIANSALLILAGSDTTATVLSGLTYFLLRDRRVMELVVREVRGAFEREEDIVLGAGGVGKLKYMGACLEEALRMYPAAPVALQRIVPGEGAWIAGVWVPGGTIVSVPQIATNLSTLNFHLPDFFVPERFLGDERFINDQRQALNPFSLGPRNCIGKNLAYAEMRLILARVLWNFDIEFAEGEESKDWLDQKSWTLWDKGPLNVVLRKREGI